MIPRELEGKIIRLYQAEGWAVGAIATSVGVHHSTVLRVIHDTGLKRPKQTRISKLDPYMPFILEKLEEYPKITAKCLHGMLQKRGYSGSDSHFRRVIGRIRPRKAPEAFLRLSTLQGEQGQVDWAHMGTVPIGTATRPLMAFVMVLSWSRHIFVQFSYDQRMGSFLRGHVAAFNFFKGVPRVALYDNLKSAVTSRRGQAIQLNETLLHFSDHYRYEPRPVAPYRGNEKGRVERAIRYLKDNFYTGRDTSNLDQLNTEVLAWCRDVAGARVCQEDPSLTVLEAWKTEHHALLGLPDDAFETWDLADVRVPKTPYIRFDKNDYSVPHDRVRRCLQVQADSHRVRILEGGELIADHRRSWAVGEQIEEPKHIEALVSFKREAREHRGKDRLVRTVPNARVFLEQTGRLGHNVGSATAGLLRLLDTHGQESMAKAIDEALKAGTFHVAAVRQCLEHYREAAGLPPKLSLNVSSKAKDVEVVPHALGDYDLENTP